MVMVINLRVITRTRSAQLTKIKSDTASTLLPLVTGNGGGGGQQDGRNEIASWSVSVHTSTTASEHVITAISVTTGSVTTGSVTVDTTSTLGEHIIKTFAATESDGGCGSYDAGNENVGESDKATPTSACGLIHESVLSIAGINDR